MVDASIIRIFDQGFDQVEKKVPANASRNDIYELVREIFYDIAEEIEENHPYLIDTEDDENERWFDEYYDILVPDWFQELLEKD